MSPEPKVNLVKFQCDSHDGIYSLVVLSASVKSIYCG